MLLLQKLDDSNDIWGSKFYNLSENKIAIFELKLKPEVDDEKNYYYFYYFFKMPMLPNSEEAEAESGEPNPSNTKIYLSNILNSNIYENFIEISFLFGFGF